MTRDHDSTHKKIALLATGDEITVGDILNTNSKEIAATLFKEGMHTGYHMVASDHISEIENAIAYLLQTHDALIITGGLGPTSDDLTRFALANVLKLPLHFDNATWDSICIRFQNFGLGVPPESNQQQALFPQAAVIFENPNGSAAGCAVEVGNKWIFMLPGPPIECLPMFQNYVVPILKKHHYASTFFFESWLLFGVSEGHIAEKLEQVVKSYSCKTGYRLCSPYVEFKIYSTQPEHFDELVSDIEKLITPYLINDGKVPASILLKNKINTVNKPLNIADFVTGGMLETLLLTPQTSKKILFSKDENLPNGFVIKGLENYWNNIDTNKAQLTITFPNSHIQHYEIPFRGERVRGYALEFISWKILEYLTNDAAIN